MKHSIILVILLGFLLTVAPAKSATYSMSIDSISISSSNPHVTGMYSVEVEVEYSAPQGVEVTNCRAKVLALPTGWDVLNDYDENYKSLSTCSGTTYFYLRPSSTGSYSASDITVEVRGEDQSGQNTINPDTDSPSGTIEVKNQPVLSVTITSLSKTSVIRGDSVTMGYSVSNTGGSDTAPSEDTVLTITSSPSGSVTFSGGATSTTVGSGTVNPGQTVTGTKVLKVTSSYTSSNSLSFTIRSTAANTANTGTDSDSLSCSDCVEEGGDGDGDGAPSGGGISVSGGREENVTNVTELSQRPTLVPGVGLRNNTKLQAAIEKVLNIGKMSEQAVENLMRLSQSISSDLNTTRNFKVENNVTQISTKMKYNGEKKVKNLIVYDKVPKTFANSSDDITVTATGAKIEVVESDPSYALVYDEVSPGQEITWTYQTSGEKESSLLNDIITEVYAVSLEEEVEEIPEEISTDILIWIVAIGLGAFIIILITVFLSKKKKKGGKRYSKNYSKEFDRIKEEVRKD